MSPTCRNRPTQRTLFHDVLELTTVVALVFTIGWCGTRVAETAHRQPVRSDASGVITLRIAKSDRQGEVTFEEGGNYAGWWHCSGNWKIDWTLAPAFAGKYRVHVRVSLPDVRGEKGIKVKIDDQELTAVVLKSRDPSRWSDVDLGVVSLEAKPYSLTVLPIESTESGSLNVKLVTLQLVSSEAK